MNTAWIFFFVIAVICVIAIIIRFIFYENYLKRKKVFQKGDHILVNGIDRGMIDKVKKNRLTLK